MGMELFHPPGRHAEDQSVADFVTAHYGAEAVDYLAEPLLSGIYGGSPSTLSIQSVLPRFVELEAKYGSLTKGVLAEMKANKAQAKRLPLFRTLKGGLGDLVLRADRELRRATPLSCTGAPKLSSGPAAASAFAWKTAGSNARNWCWRARRTTPPSSRQGWTGAWRTCWAASPTVRR